MTKAGWRSWTAAKKTHLIGVSVEGDLQELELESLSLPCISEIYVVYQPSSDVVIRHHLKDGSEERFSLGAFNEHPYEAPEEDLNREKDRENRPVDPTRLPGFVEATSERLFFVPWHAETIVELVSGEVLDRALLPQAGSFRRGIKEILARDNEDLAALQMQIELAHFDTVPKGQNSNFGLRLPSCPSTLVNGIAEEHVGDLSKRFELETHGWRWGGLAREGGIVGSLQKPDVDEVIDALQWMKKANLLPINCTGSVGESYNRTLGIPSDPVPDATPFSVDGERLWVRALLETTRTGARPEIDAAWVK
ncbi:MAG: hypothetical protein GY822_08425 [Deltaproteobacteria bacterium]|nr:hypothetical protein [Deltaproteobacteria bacterium]